MKRILLFVITNLAVVAVLGTVLHLLGLEDILAANGSSLDLSALLVFSAIVGFTGALLSLFISKWSAIHLTGARVINNPSNAQEQWMIATVQQQANAVDIGMPDVAIYDSPEINAFATGWNRNNALVAVSTGLLHKMHQSEAEAVLAHEVSHIANGDMITMTLLQGVLNTFVIFISRVIGHAIDRTVFKTQNGHGPAFFVVSLVAQLLLGILASVVAMWFSRHREYRADAGAAQMVGKNKMIAALQRLKSNHDADLPDQLDAMGISGRNRVTALFRSHPPLDDRIAALAAL